MMAAGGKDGSGGRAFCCALMVVGGGVVCDDFPCRWLDVTFESLILSRGSSLSLPQNKVLKDVIVVDSGRGGVGVFSFALMVVVNIGVVFVLRNGVLCRLLDVAIVIGAVVVLRNGVLCRLLDVAIGSWILSRGPSWSLCQNDVGNDCMVGDCDGGSGSVSCCAVVVVVVVIVVLCDGILCCWSAHSMCILKRLLCFSVWYEGLSSSMMRKTSL